MNNIAIDCNLGYDINCQLVATYYECVFESFLYRFVRNFDRIRTEFTRTACNDRVMKA